VKQASDDWYLRDCIHLFFFTPILFTHLYTMVFPVVLQFISFFFFGNFGRDKYLFSLDVSEWK
jgi:hypothetical protein